MSQYCVENYWVAGYATGDISSIAASANAQASASSGVSGLIRNTGYRSQGVSSADIAAIRRIFQAFKAGAESTAKSGGALTLNAATSHDALSAMTNAASATYTRQGGRSEAVGSALAAMRLKWEIEDEPVDSWGNSAEPSDTWANAAEPSDSWSDATDPVDSWSSVTEGSSSWTDELLPHETNNEGIQ